MDWNERFSGEEFHFGEAPAAFVRDHLGGLGAGAHVLTIAEGEGRNAVWLARQGCRVTAIEPTGTGREKAMALAARHGVTMEWRQESLESYGWPSNGFDVVLGCFFQFADPRLRAEILAGMARTTMPGGTVFLHGSARGNWGTARAGRAANRICGRRTVCCRPSPVGRWSGPRIMTPCWTRGRAIRDRRPWSM